MTQKDAGMICFVLRLLEFNQFFSTIEGKVWKGRDLVVKRREVDERKEVNALKGLDVKKRR